MQATAGKTASLGSEPPAPLCLVASARRASVGFYSGHGGQPARRSARTADLWTSGLPIQRQSAAEPIVWLRHHLRCTRTATTRRAILLAICLVL